MADDANAPAAEAGFSNAAPSKLPKGWKKDEKTGIAFIEETGLTPVQLLVSEAGFGLIAGEVRGVAPEVAARMIKAESAVLVFPK